MTDFTFYTPTKVIFGKGQYLNVGKVISSYGYKKIMLHYGGGSLKKSGAYEAIVASLNSENIEFVELGGVEPNPKLSLIRKGMDICRAEGVEFILAAGGGSVIDSAKAIAAGIGSNCDPWLFSTKQASPSGALKVGVVLTIAASGSEMSSSAVITNDSNAIKRGFRSEFNRPLFAILDPELTYTLSPYQTACGITDIMMHTLERYLSMPGAAEPTDSIALAVLKSTVNAGRKALACPTDYEARATLMWCGSLSHNDITGAGRESFMIAHQIEHELSGMFDHVAHGAGLAVVFPAWAKYVYKHNIAKFESYARSVWGKESALEGITATEEYFKEIGMPTRLGELGISEDVIPELAEKCTEKGTRKLDGYIKYGQKEVEDIYRLAL